MTKFPSLKSDRGRDPFAGTTFVVEDEPDAVMASIVRTVIELIAEGDFEQAEKYVRKGLERDPQHPKCLAYLAVCVAASGLKPDTASQIARGVIREHPDEATGHYALGQVNLLGDKRAAAFRHFARARELGATDQELQRELQRVEPRRQSVFAALPRNHFLNVVFGRLRAALLGGHKRS